jgi:hypothetical protein
VTVFTDKLPGIDGIIDTAWNGKAVLETELYRHNQVQWKDVFLSVLKLSSYGEENYVKFNASSRGVFLNKFRT